MWLDTFNRGEFDALADYLDPDVELQEWPAAPGAQVYHGPDAARRAIDNWFDVWEWMHVEIEDIVEIDDRLLVTFHQRAKAKSSEIEVEIRSFNVYTFRDSKITRIQLFTEKEPALEAAGLAGAEDVGAKVRAGYEAFNRGDYEAFAEILDPAVEWEHSPASGAPEEGTYRGRDEVLRLLERLRDAWEDQVFELDEVAWKGPDEYVVRGTVRATGRISGVALDSGCEYRLKLRDGRATRVRFTLTGPASRKSDADLIREVNEAMAAGDLKTVSEHLHEDIVWEHNVGGGSPEEGVYRGRDEVIALFERVLEPWELMRLDVDRISELEAGKVEIEGELHFKHRSSAAEVIEPYVQRGEIRDGLLVKGEMVFGHRPVAREERR
jgi:ketosteroid isomerase-like protein